MNGWGDLGVVETIFEEEMDDLQSLSSTPLSSPSSPLQSCVDAWTTTTGKKPDVNIFVQGTCFHLHKELLISKSSYLKRQLIGVSDLTLSPPLKITADTFKQLADFCYSGHAIITPFNLAALRTAAELLKIDGGSGETLRQKTESYFSTVVAVNEGFAVSVLRSCLTLLPEAEQTAFLASRCLEALFSLDDGNGDGNRDGIVTCADVLKTVAPEDFGVIADSMHKRYTRSHDLLYRVVDLYFLVYSGKITEEQKTQICSCIDCGILTSSLLMHAVQNPRMPLRFVVQAMLVEQLNTHRSIFSHLSSSAAARHPPQPAEPLGAILERDAALRQVAQLRAAIETTSSRILSLEEELSGMKKILGGSEGERERQGSSLLLSGDQGRSSSCRFFGGTNGNKVERGERGSVSLSLLRSGEKKAAHDQNVKAAKRSFGQRLIKGLKGAFGGHKSSNKLKDIEKKKCDGRDERGERRGVVFDDGGVMEVFDGGHPHYRSLSIS